MASRGVREHGFEYFNKVVGLPSKGLSSRHLDFSYVTMEDCEKFWGARCSNSHGFKYKKQCIDVKMVSYVEELWPKVYQRSPITNNKINLSFAKGVLVDRKGCDVNWATFATKVQSRPSHKHTRQAKNYHAERGFDTSWLGR